LLKTERTNPPEGGSVEIHSNYSAYLNAGTSSTCDEAKLHKTIATHHTQASKIEDINFISPFPIVSSVSI
jgi:hypothetical protein